ncbi:toprim domain-containing protein, partial [Candidatus Gottesmanbacteria bacterium]|nr:toprim domain-containing protein [Candidatus Gottesmanbacteria bacterium]
EINHLAAEFFHFLLTKHALGVRGREYLEKRRIKKETIETFMLGYAPNSWDSLSKYLQKKGYCTEDICLSGLTIKSDSGRFYDRFRGRLMFTLKDHRGNMIGFSGRKLVDTTDSQAKYINSPETPVYHKGSTLYGMDVTKEYIKKSGEAVIVEGEFDFLSSFQSGVVNAVAIKGSALTEDQVLLLKRYTENLIMALDSDFAGNEAARRGIEVADNTGLTVKVVRLLYGKDPAECVEKSPHLWKDSVAKAVPIYDFVIDTALSKYDKSTADGKKKIGDEVLPLIAKIQNPIIASHYVKKLTRELEVNEESIEMLIRRIGKNEGKKPPLGIPLAVHNRVEMIEEYLLSLIIQSKSPKISLEKVMTITATEDYNLPAVSKIISLLSG